MAMVLLLACVSCSSNAAPMPIEQAQELWENPPPTPNFINYSTRSSDEFAFETEDVCVAVNEYNIWEPGDNGNDTSEAIQRTARLYVDNRRITNLRFGVGTAAVIRFGATRQDVLGSHNFGTGVCFDTSNFPPGYYTAMLQFASTSGIEYSHTWAFWLKE